MKHAEVYLNEHRSDGLHDGIESMFRELKGVGAKKLFIEGSPGSQGFVDERVADMGLLIKEPGFDLERTLLAQRSLYDQETNPVERKLILQNTEYLLAATYGIRLYCSDEDQGFLSVYYMLEHKRRDLGLPNNELGDLKAALALIEDPERNPLFPMTDEHFIAGVRDINAHIQANDYSGGLKAAIDARMARDVDIAAFIDRNSDDNEIVGVLYGAHHGDINRLESNSIPIALMERDFTVGIHEIDAQNGIIQTLFMALPEGHPVRANPPQPLQNPGRKPQGHT